MTSSDSTAEIAGPVGVVGTGFPNLPGIEDKILAESRQGYFLARVAKILERSVEELAFGKDGKRGGPCILESLRKSRRIKWFADHPA